MNQASIMERDLAGWDAPKPPATQPKTLDDATAQIAFLWCLEKVTRKRAALLYKLHKKQALRALDLEAERLRLQRLFIPVNEIPTARQTYLQRVKSKEEIKSEWGKLTAEELDAKIAALEQLKSF